MSEEEKGKGKGKEKDPEKKDAENKRLQGWKGGGVGRCSSSPRMTLTCSKATRLIVVRSRGT